MRTQKSMNAKKSGIMNTGAEINFTIEFDAYLDGCCIHSYVTSVYLDHIRCAVSQKSIL